MWLICSLELNYPLYSYGFGDGNMELMNRDGNLILFTEFLFHGVLLRSWSFLDMIRKFVGGKLLSIAIRDKIAMVLEKDIR